MTEKSKWEMNITKDLKIQQHDERNLVVLRLEQIYNPIKKETNLVWKNKGYYGTVKSALLNVLYKDMLIDLKEIETLRDYRKQSIEQYKTIKQMLEE